MKLGEFNLRNLDFQRMGGWPSPVKLVFSAIIFVVIVALGWWWLIEPKRLELNNISAKEMELMQEFEVKQAKVVNLAAYEEQLKEIEQLVNRMTERLPSKTDMPKVLEQISQSALAAGIENEKFDSSGAETTPTPEGAQGADKVYVYAEKPINLRMIGTYHQFGSFVSEVAGLKRVVILKMSDISLQPQTGAADPAKSAADPGLLVLEGTVKVYRFLDESEIQEKQAAAATPAAGT